MLSSKQNTFNEPTPIANLHLAIKEVTDVSGNIRTKVFKSIDTQKIDFGFYILEIHETYYTTTFSHLCFS